MSRGFSSTERPQLQSLFPFLVSNHLFPHPLFLSSPITLFSKILFSIVFEKRSFVRLRVCKQELAFSQMHRSLDEGGGLVSPIKSHAANSEDASAVRSLRHDMDIWANRPSRHPVGNKAPSPGGLSPGT